MGTYKSLQALTQAGRKSRLKAEGVGGTKGNWRNERRENDDANVKIVKFGRRKGSVMNPQLNQINDRYWLTGIWTGKSKLGERNIR